MCPETRRLIQVLPEGSEETKQMFDTLLGENLIGRKQFIADEGYKYLELAEMS
jgi:DNA gyrase subunit B